MPSVFLRHTALAALILLTTPACDDTPSETPDAGTQVPDSGQPDAGSGFMAGGSLTPGPGKQVPESGKLVVLWSVSSSSPDYLYKFGEGTSSGATFALPLPTPPPAEALNQAELGVGLVLLMPTSFSLADGRYEGEDIFFDALIGAAGQYAIIYRANAQVVAPGWVSLFPVGYSCGKGVEAPEGSSFDTFEPVSCASLNITVDDAANIDFVNWT
ncbi:hypothetical protein [Corallococcus sicarius]|uniref:Uncharacterized protein n=1 Tax=Corallococcus sicarius TaxID=2316726 RepID=A0A3A8N4G7_9BACT|nr:hypothetical protein [Corallococcus sicarius]RKH38823.1 hypothetical protein D7X12_25305 [Corallococcus sicarius]